MNFPAANYVLLAVFAVAVGATVSGALIAVLSTRTIRSVCGLALCCCGLAGLYYFLQSPFLSLMEILIYVGAICVTIIFAVMLAEPDEAPPTARTVATVGWGASALVICGFVFWGITHLGLNHPWAAPNARLNQGSLKDLGIALLTSYSMAFEMISLVLLVSVLGALVIARQGRTKS